MIVFETCYFLFFVPTHFLIFSPYIPLADQHEHNTGAEYVAREPESEGSIVTGSPRPKDETKASVDLESLDGRKDGVANSPLSQILGVAILEVGIALHRRVNLFLL